MLASAALVCRSWLFPARVRLYRDLYMDNWEVSHSDKLADILLNQPLLRSLIRRPILRYINTIRPCPTFFDWMALLPEHSFPSVELDIIESSEQTSLPTLAHLLDFPAVSTTLRLIVRGRALITPERLNRVLSMPCLESLSFMISESAATHLKDITMFPNLRRLSIEADTFSPLFAKLLHGLPSSLERFDLHCNGVKDSDIKLLCQALERHSPGLRHLVLLGQCFSEPYYLDSFVASFPHLETLLLPRGLYTPDLVSYLPPTVSSLILCTLPLLERSYVDEYIVALKNHCGRLPLLKSLTIVGCLIAPKEYEPLAKLCNALDITLRHYAMSYIDILGDTLIRNPS